MTKMQRNEEKRPRGEEKPVGAGRFAEAAVPRKLSEDFLKDIPESLFRINDRTFLVKHPDKKLALMDLQEGINQFEIGSEIYDFVLMPDSRPEEMSQAAIVLASKALVTASNAMVNPPVLTMQNAGKEDLKQASSAWAECRKKHNLYAFATMSERIDDVVFSMDAETQPVEKSTRTITKEQGFCGYEKLKNAIDNAWQDATVPEQFQTFDSLAGSGGERFRDSSVAIASKILSRHDNALLERPGIPWADLIWNYWMEEAGLVQAMNVLALRFQNRAVPGRADFLRNFELDALRPLSHFIWEYIEAEPHRLSVVRRAYEYEHEYGLRLLGKAVEKMDPYERRHGFIGGFNTLVSLAHKLFRDEDDLQRKADAFPLLNQLQELQSLVQEGAHNQYPELVKKARTEMLMQQYIFTLSPVQEFIRSRPMVVYEEPWMGPLDAMRQAMGWDPVSVSVYHKLAEKSEALLTTIRNYDWVHENVTDAARSWAQSFRNEIQSYAHAYRTVTGVDLTDPVLDPEHATQPSQLIRARMDALRR